MYLGCQKWAKGTGGLRLKCQQRFTRCVLNRSTLSVRSFSRESREMRASMFIGRVLEGHQVITQPGHQDVLLSLVKAEGQIDDRMLSRRYRAAIQSTISERRQRAGVKGSTSRASGIRSYLCVSCTLLCGRLFKFLIAQVAKTPICAETPIPVR